MFELENGFFGGRNAEIVINITKDEGVLAMRREEGRQIVPFKTMVIVIAKNDTEYRT